jgi:hypothetical protein
MCYDRGAGDDPRALMPARLDWDSAQRGQSSQRARLADLDDVRLEATEERSLYFSQFLEAGFEDEPVVQEPARDRHGNWKETVS